MDEQVNGEMITITCIACANPFTSLQSYISRHKNFQVQIYSTCIYNRGKCCKVKHLYFSELSHQYTSHHTFQGLVPQVSFLF